MKYSVSLETFGFPLNLNYACFSFSQVSLLYIAQYHNHRFAPGPVQICPPKNPFNGEKIATHTTSGVVRFGRLKVQTTI